MLLLLLQSGNVVVESASRLEIQAVNTVGSVATQNDLEELRQSREIESGPNSSDGCEW